MSDGRSAYEAAYQANLRFDGFGLETATIAPCPGCAAPDFARMPLLTPMAELEKGATCKACGRSFRAVLGLEANATSIEMVQTGGEDLPGYLSWIHREPPASLAAPPPGWPEKPTCHGDVTQGGIFKLDATTWREPNPRPAEATTGHVRALYRTCSYCGSVHPEDLLKFLAELDRGHTLGGADWKYGWPHKFYLKGGAFGKFYNEHLLDEGYSPETLALLTAAIERHAGIRFDVKDGKLGYAAPHRGYQR